MRITFMIGNGFDKSVGLKSGYDDFYNSLPENTENDIIKSIKADTALWSDMEESLGRYYTEEIAKNQDRFMTQKHELEILLEEYLLEEQKKADYKKNEDISAEMKRSILEFYKSLAAKDSRAVTDLLGAITEPVRYSFIVFNYTNVFENCINLMKPRCKEIAP